MPRGKPSTSASGRIEQSTDRNQKRAGMRLAARLLPSRPATNPCVTIVGIGRSTRLVLVSADFSHAQSWRRLQGQPKHLGRYEKAGRYVGQQHAYFLRENMGRFRRRERENGCAKCYWSVGRVC